jgi:hypothetical protein
MGRILRIMTRGENDKKAPCVAHVRPFCSAKRGEIHDARLIAKKLRRNPQLPPEADTGIAVVLLLNMQTMKTLTAEHEGDDRAGAIAALREMTRLYLARKLGSK